MQVLKIDNQHAFFFSKSAGKLKSVLELSGSDVYELVSLIIENDEIEMDSLPESGSLPNPAEGIIYKDLFDKLTTLNNTKATLLAPIKQEYEESLKQYDAVSGQTKK
jgi:hypothetical protein